MNKTEWDLPEVPENVHQAVLEALEKLDTVVEDSERKTEMRGKRYKKRAAFLIAAAMTAILGTTVLAAELFSWNERAEEVFDSNKELQDKLTEEKFAKDEYTKVTDNGLTITAIQTIQDENCFYALFEVEAEDPSIVIDENSDMEYQIDWGGKEDPFSMRGSNFIKKEGQENSGYFEIFGGKADTASTEDMMMNLHFTALQKQGEKAAEGENIRTGNWDFSITIHQTPGTSYDIEKEYQILGYPVQVREVRLSPLTVTIVYDGDDIMTLEKGEGLSFDQCDIMPIRVNGLKYQDGTIVEENEHRMKEGFDEEGNFYVTARFSSVAEVEKVKALLLGDEMTEVEIPKEK